MSEPLNQPTFHLPSPLTDQYDHTGTGLGTPPTWLAEQGGGGAAGPSYGTSLPSSPSDGEEAILVNSVTNPAFAWCFRYNAGSTSAYKWDFIGGSWWTAYVDADEMVSNPNTWVDFATVGPAITVPRSGEYKFAASATMYNDYAGGGIVQIGVTIGAGTPSAGFFIQASQPNQGNQSRLAFGPGPRIVAAASDSIRLRYASTNYNEHAMQRHLALVPVRVS
jgi:hypothetical protein